MAHYPNAKQRELARLNVALDAAHGAVRYWAMRAQSWAPADLAAYGAARAHVDELRAQREALYSPRYGAD